MDPPGSTRWVVIPTALRGRRHELPLTVFRVARDVIEDTTWLSQGLDAVRSEILDRLYNNLNYLPDPDLISVAFLDDLRSSLHHRHYSLRPWSYPKWEDEPESSTDPSSSSDDSPSSPDTGLQDQNETIPETEYQQNLSNQEDDSASQSSEPSSPQFKRATTSMSQETMKIATTLHQQELPTPSRPPVKASQAPSLLQTRT